MLGFLSKPPVAALLRANQQSAPNRKLRRILGIPPNPGDPAFARNVRAARCLWRAPCRFVSGIADRSQIRQATKQNPKHFVPSQRRFLDLRWRERPAEIPAASATQLTV